MLACAHSDDSSYCQDYDLDPAKWYLTCPELSSGYVVSMIGSDGHQDTVGVYEARTVVPVRLVVPGRGVIIVHLECMA